jgi:hypothetical protein
MIIPESNTQLQNNHLGQKGFTMKYYIFNQRIWVLPILALFAITGISIPYTNHIDTSQESDVAVIKTMARVDCWQIDFETNIVSCRNNVPRCRAGWNIGTPSPPLRCNN